jgi:hypothetical protein
MNRPQGASAGKVKPDISPSSWQDYAKAPKELISAVGHYRPYEGKHCCQAWTVGEEPYLVWFAGFGREPKYWRKISKPEGI